MGECQNNFFHQVQDLVPGFLAYKLALDLELDVGLV